MPIFEAPDGSERHLPPTRRSVPGRLARRYLRGARNSNERGVRVRRLLLLAGTEILGLPLRRLAQCFRVHETTASRDVASVLDSLREIAENDDADASPDALFIREHRFDDGGGI